MSVVAGDLIKFQSAVHADDDDDANVGGAINTAGRLDQLVLAAADDLEALSDNAGDTTQTITVVGRNAAGEIVTEGPHTLTGTTPVAMGATVFERVLKVTLSASAAGTVTLRRGSAGATVVTLPPGITSQRSLFYDSASEATEVPRYEKETWRNGNGTNTLNAAKFKLTADPQARVKIGVENSDNQTTADRLTAPSGVTFVDDGVEIDITSLAAGADKGLWIEQRLPADDPAFLSTFTTELAGTTT